VTARPSSLHCPRTQAIPASRPGEEARPLEHVCLSRPMSAAGESRHNAQKRDSAIDLACVKRRKLKNEENNFSLIDRSPDSPSGFVLFAASLSAPGALMQVPARRDAALGCAASHSRRHCPFPRHIPQGAPRKYVLTRAL
jgi:hypothetical protein